MTERGSTQHSPRVDEELAHETAPLTQGSPTESRAEEWRLKEGPGDGEPFPDSQIGHVDDAPPGSLSADEVEQRSLLAISLRPSAFPATGRELRAVAEAEHADPVVMGWLANLPENAEFANVQDVWEALGGNTEHRDVAPVDVAPVDVAAEPPPVSRSERADDRPPAASGGQMREPEHAAEPSLAERALQVPVLAVRTTKHAAGVVLSFGTDVLGRLSRLRRGSDRSDQ